ncbi:MAG: hypothetical protein QXE66_04410 [Desulfurococcaceae archaeon]
MLKLSDSKEVLRPGNYHYIRATLGSVRCSKVRVSSVYVITAEPRVYSAKLYNTTALSELNPIREEVPILPPRSHQIIPVEVHRNVWDIESVLSGSGFVLAKPDNNFNPSRLELLDSYTPLLEGVETASGRWVTQRVLSSAEISMSNVGVRNVFLGYDPRDPSKYVLLITSDTSITITLNGNRNTFCSNLPATRVKIYGFRSTAREGIIRISGDTNRFGSGVWIVKPDQDVAKYTFVGGTNRGSISMVGIADRVEIYCFETGLNKYTSYYPYILFMNTVGEPRRASILFTTIDAAYGFANTLNDRPGSTSLQDFSRLPLALVYKGMGINNNNTKAVLLLLNYRFHDNEGSDFDGVTVDRPIIILGIIDDGNRVVSYRSFTFRELTRYEDTYPPTAQAQSSLVFIPIPSKDSVGIKNFYVFIIVQDPYLRNNTYDDVDITIYVESLTIILYE